MLWHGLGTVSTGAGHTWGTALDRSWSSALIEFGPGLSWLGLFSFPDVPRANSDHPSCGIPTGMQSQGMASPQLCAEKARCHSPTHLIPKHLINLRQHPSAAGLISQAHQERCTNVRQQGRQQRVHGERGRRPEGPVAPHPIAFASH